MTAESNSVLIDFFNNNLPWDIHQLEVLIKNGVDLNEPLSTEDGSRPIHIAAAKGDVKVVELLLDNGAGVDAPDYNGDTAIHYASRQGHFEVVQLLLQRKANVNSKNSKNQSALHCLSLTSESSENVEGMVEIFVQSGASLDDQDNEGLRPVHIAVKENNLDLLLMLIDKGAMVNLKDHNGWTPLHHAAFNDWPEMVEYLLMSGASLEIRNDEGETALHLAAKRNSTDSLLKMINAGALLDVKDSKGWTALHYAIKLDNSEAVLCLLQNGASIDVLDPIVRRPDVNRNASNQLYPKKGCFFTCAFSFKLSQKSTPIATLIADHISLLKLAGVTVAEHVLINMFGESKGKAMQEVRRMKVTAVTDGFRLIDAFSNIAIPSYLLDPNVMEQLNSLFQNPDFYKMFPVYAEMLKSTVSKAMKSRYYLMKRAKWSMMSCNRKICCRLTPDLAWEKILGFLNLEDLVHIIQSEI